ncbi:MAG: hypothetical protein NUV42_01405, partial [Candidatus Yonathbacteria bacterium]|nr:hypothetical protein [Candidatus Yonathbacteria bacterium]
PFHFFFRFAVAPWITKCTWIFIVAYTLLKNLGGGVGGGDARKMQGNFLVFAHASLRACPRRIGSHSRTIGAYEAVSSHHALRACDSVLIRI